MPASKKSLPIPHQKSASPESRAKSQAKSLCLASTDLYGDRTHFSPRDRKWIGEVQASPVRLAGWFIWQLANAPHGTFTVHFMTVPIALIFTIVHMLMGLKVGGLRIWRSMFV
jgi:hypothetical protein